MKYTEFLYFKDLFFEMAENDDSCLDEGPRTLDEQSVPNYFDELSHRKCT